jgi:hypothetical protein
VPNVGEHEKKSGGLASPADPKPTAEAHYFGKGGWLGAMPTGSAVAPAGSPLAATLIFVFTFVLVFVLVFVFTAVGAIVFM